jgi:hypothetical protein
VALSGRLAHGQGQGGGALCPPAAVTAGPAVAQTEDFFISIDGSGSAATAYDLLPYLASVLSSHASFDAPISRPLDTPVQQQQQKPQQQQQLPQQEQQQQQPQEQQRQQQQQQQEQPDSAAMAVESDPEEQGLSQIQRLLAALQLLQDLQALISRALTARVQQQLEQTGVGGLLNEQQLQQVLAALLQQHHPMNDAPRMQQLEQLARGLDGVLSQQRQIWQQQHQQRQQQPQQPGLAAAHAVQAPASLHQGAAATSAAGEQLYNLLQRLHSVDTDAALPAGLAGQGSSATRVEGLLQRASGALGRQPEPAAGVGQ